MICAFIAERCSDLPVAVCCRVMKVPTSTFYAWRADPVSVRDWSDALLTNTIGRSMPRHGAPMDHHACMLS